MTPARAIALVIAVAAALKLLIVWQLAGHPLVQPDIGLDTSAYAELAKRVVAGDWGLGPGLYYVSPLYIYVLAAGLALTDSFTAVRVLQVLAGAVAVGGIWSMTRSWATPRAAWFAAGLAALTGLITFYEALILQASIDVALTTAALLALTWALKGRGVRWFTITGIIIGLASLNRPNMSIAAAGLAAVLLLQKRVRPALLFGAGVLIGIAPVVVRNIVVADQWSLVSSHGGLNFYIGNSPAATGFYTEVPGIGPDIRGQSHDARRVAEQAMGRSLTDAEVSDYFMDLAWTWIREHPHAAAGLFVRKLAYVFHGQHVALPYSYPFFAYDANTALRFYVAGPWLLVPLGLVGLWFLFRQVEDRANVRAWIAFVPIYAVSVALFFVAERYRLPLLVPLCVGSGVALDAIAAMVSRRAWQSLVAPVLAGVALLGLVNWRMPSRDDRWNEGMRMAERLAILNRDAEAEAWVNKIAPTAPYPGRAHYSLGLQYMLGGELDPALRYLREAQRLNPGHADIEYTFGQALLKSGRPAEALPHLQRGFDSGTKARVAGYDLALALQATGDPAGAARIIERITPAPGDDAEVWLQIGRLAAGVKAPQLAERFFRQGAALAPSSAAARIQYGISLLVLNRIPEAARELEAAVRLDPRDADALAHLAYCELVLGRPDDARRHADAALAINPAHPLATGVRAKT
jgi:Tfp pilus assembly protein PilF